MPNFLIITGFCGVWALFSYLYFFRKSSSGNSKVSKSGSQKDPEDVLVPSQKVVVNVVYDEKIKPVDLEVLANMVINVDDLLRGTYKVPEKLLERMKSVDEGSGKKERCITKEESAFKEEGLGLGLQDEPEAAPLRDREEEVSDIENDQKVPIDTDKIDFNIH
jgi:hypothetical protein